MNTTCCLLLLGGLIMGGGAGWVARARRRAAERMERVRRVAYATKRDVWAQLYADTPTIGPHPIPALDYPAIWRREPGALTPLEQAMADANRRMTE
jgi:hypothetical protein